MRDCGDVFIMSAQGRRAEIAIELHRVAALRSADDLHELAPMLSTEPDLARTTLYFTLNAYSVSSLSPASRAPPQPCHHTAMMVRF